MTETAWTVVFAGAAAEDLTLVEEHLDQAYRGFGESQAEARRHAQFRIEAIIAAAERLAAAPYRGEAHGDLLPCLQHLALDGVIYWFVTDAESALVRVLAIFFGGQDHQRRMLIRLLQNSAQ